MFARWRYMMCRRFNWHWYVWRDMVTYCETGHPDHEDRIILLRNETFCWCRCCDVTPQSVNVDYTPLPASYLPENVELKPYF